MDSKYSQFSWLTMLKLSIILSTYIHVSSAQLANLSQIFNIVPMRETDINRTHTCGFQTTDKEEATYSFQGDPKIFCSFNINVPDGLNIAIEMPDTMPQELLYLFYEWVDNQESMYAVITEQHGKCFIIVGHHNQLKIHLLGNANLSFRFVLSDDDNNCSANLDNKPSGAMDRCTAKCNNVKTYVSMVSCEAGFTGEIQSWEPCRVSFPKSCNITLRYKEAEMTCGKLGQQSKKFLVVYPYIGYLDLSRNSIVDITENALQALPNLKRLGLAENLLERLPNDLFHDMSNLKEMYLSNNQLISLPPGIFQGLVSLIQLDLHENQVFSLPRETFMGLKSLKYLYLHSNKLTTLNGRLFQNLNNLEILTLNDNSIETLYKDIFSNLTSLLRLDLGKNQVFSLPSEIFIYLKNLKHLYLYINNLTTLNDRLFQNLRNLEVLSLNDNLIENLTNDTFTDLTSLNILYLYGNKLSRLHNGLFNAMGNLEVLALQDNLLTWIDSDIFSPLPNLVALSLSDNLLKEVHRQWFQNFSFQSKTFMGSKRLSHLYLHSNKLTTLNGRLFQDLSNLEILSLHDNSIEILSNDTFTGLTSLKHLFLYENVLRRLRNGLFNAMGNLEVLFLDENLLTWIDSDIFSPLPNLVALTLGDNLLKEVHRRWFQNLVHLENLWLYGNPGITLDINNFENCRNLKVLDLSGNEHKNLEVDIFQQTLSLQSLNIADNRLTNIPNIKHLHQLRQLDLRKNPLLEITTESFIGLSEDTEIFVTQHEICNCYIPALVNCSAAGKRSPYLTCDRLLADRTLVVIIWVISLNALGGNLFVLGWRRRKATTQKNKVQALLLRSLAMSDFLMGVYMIIIASADIYFGDSFPLQAESWRSGITCKIAGTLSILSSEASVFFVTLISIDRFICIRFPFSTRKISHKSAKGIVILTWIASFALGIIPSVLAGRNFKFYDNSHVCIGLPLALTEMFKTEESQIRIHKGGYWYELGVISTESQGLVSGKYFSTAIFLGLNLFCYLVIFMCYFEIVRFVFRSSKRAGLNKEIKKQLRMTAKVAAIVTTDFACWFPIIILGILVQTRVITLPPSVFAWCVTFVLPINSALNPYLYTISAIVSSRRKEGNVSKTSSQTAIAGRRRKEGNVSANTSQGLSMHSISGDAETQVNVQPQEMNTNV